MKYEDCIAVLIAINKDDILQAHRNNKQYKDNGISIGWKDIILDTSLKGCFRVTFENSHKKYGATNYKETISEFTGDVIWGAYYNENIPILKVFDMVINEKAYLVMSRILFDTIFDIVKNKYFEKHFNELNGKNLNDIVSLVFKLEEQEKIEKEKERIRNGEEILEYYDILRIDMDIAVRERIDNIGGVINEYGYNQCDIRYYNITINGKRNWYTYNSVMRLLNNKE